MKIAMYNQQQEFVKNSIAIIKRDLTEVQSVFQNIIRESKPEDIFDFYAEYALDIFPKELDRFDDTSLIEISYNYDDYSNWFPNLLEEYYQFDIKDIRRVLRNLSSSFTEEAYISGSFSDYIQTILEIDLDTTHISHELIPYSTCKETLEAFILEVKRKCVYSMITRVEVTD